MFDTPLTIWISLHTGVVQLAKKIAIVTYSRYYTNEKHNKTCKTLQNVQNITKRAKHLNITKNVILKTLMHSQKQ